MRPTLRVAAAQGESVPGEVATNVATAVRLASVAAGQGARVVVLPELFLTGYDPEEWARPDAAALTPDDQRLEPLSAAAREHGLVVIAGAAVRRTLLPARPGDPERQVRTLSLLVLDETGAVLAPYDKQHLLDSERPAFEAGDHGASVVVDGWELGLGVCYDGCFPEHAADAARHGALAYVCPSAYYVGSEHRRDLYYAARALDNGVYAVFSGLAGRCGRRDFSGGSAVYDPEGRPVGRVGADVPAVVVADLHAEEVRRVQELNPIGRDRRASLGVRERHMVGR